jgi:cyclopropane fatty-acyl-phospholipid synthase-like methyltransferase
VPAADPVYTSEPDFSAGWWDAMGGRTTPRTLAQLSNVVPLTARIYEDVWRKRSLTLLSGRPFPIGEELAELHEHLRVEPGDVVVDVGCSEGLYARSVAAADARAIAVDHAVPFLRRTIERAGHDDLPVECVRALAQHLPLHDGVADSVVIGGSLNEIGDLEGCLREAARVLRPGGRLFVMSLVRARTQRGRLLQAAVRPSGIVFPTVDETMDLVTGAGFTVDTTRRDRVVLRTSATRR